MAKEEAVNGVCPDGYKHVFGKVCVSQSTLEKTGLDDVKSPEVPEFTDFACESAVTLLQQAAEALEAALEVPRKLMRLAKKILGYPAKIVGEAVEGALAALDGISDSIDDLTSGPEKLMRALERALDCPFIADSPLGKSIGGMLDTLGMGSNLADEQINTMKSAVSSTASEMVNSAMASPLGSISNLNKQYKSMIKSMGVEELLTTLYDLEQCVEDLCKAYRQSEKFIERLPKSGDDVVKELGATYDKEKKKLTTSLTDAADATQQEAAKAGDQLTELSQSLKKAN
ncbi:MAG: hypothetical protein IKJ34_04310 [Mailhella sp.]|nr:hypothetical protein [Mailhella sp.]